MSAFGGKRTGAASRFVHRAVAQARLRLQVGSLVHLENAAKANGCQGTGQSRAPPPRHAMLLLCLARVRRAASWLCCGTIFQRQTRAARGSSRTIIGILAARFKAPLPDILAK